MCEFGSFAEGIVFAETTTAFGWLAALESSLTYLLVAGSSPRVRIELSNDAEIAAVPDDSRDGAAVA